MRLTTSLAFMLLFCSVTSSQIVDPKVPVQPAAPKSTRIVPATIKAVGGQLVIIDAKSAKGDVSFRWDAKTFENRATVDGKKLFLSIPDYDDDKSYQVSVISWDDKVDESVVISVQGKRKPEPKPPVADPILERLDKIESRLLALEKKSPNPPDPKPLPSVDKLYVVAIWESADSTPAVAKVMKDLGFWNSLESVGVQWFQYDKDNKIGDKYVIDAFGYRNYVNQVGLPCVLYMDKSGHVLRSEKLPDSTDKIRGVVKEFLGK